MANSFFVLKVKSSDGYCDDHGNYHAMVCNDPYVMHYCETYDDAKKLLVKESRQKCSYEWMEVVYFKESDAKATKRFAEYDERKHRYTEAFEVTWWIDKIDFTKP